MVMAPQNINANQKRDQSIFSLEVVKLTKLCLCITFTVKNTANRPQIYLGSNKAIVYGFYMKPGDELTRGCFSAGIAAWLTCRTNSAARVARTGLGSCCVRTPNLTGDVAGAS